MRSVIFCLASCLCLSGSAYGQSVRPQLAEEPSQQSIKAAPQLMKPAQQSIKAAEQSMDVYMVQISEYRLDEPIAVSGTAKEIVAHLTGPNGREKYKPVEIVRLSLMSGSESIVQFGKRTSVTTGTVSSGRSTVARQVATLEIGTVVRVEAEPAGDKVAAKFSFESSRFSSVGAEDAPPDVTNTEIKGAQFFEFGVPVLIGGTTAENTSFVIMTITK